LHIHWLQHVEFEGLGLINSWIKQRGHKLSCTRFWANDPLPETESIDMLIVMGGPMGVSDQAFYPWLIDEKIFIRRVLGGPAVVLGICLGAQLLADALGADVYPNSEKEIGWFPVTVASSLPQWAANIFPSEMMMFHWHGDTFDIPIDAVPLCSSRACTNQGFVLGNRVVGLQFHPEITPHGVASLIKNCREELVAGPWIQAEPDIVGDRDWLKSANLTMNNLLNHLELQVNESD